ncbi:glucosyl transferase [Thioclava dalianensis]|uniref:Glucosyl transferase n=1 Tax=Thioclava dalianensis TaxID=1185766 RepID=A0A074THL8_9RHOB|nr:glycosyltransferase family 2 protein [Thioclava dalianensis]KEP71186.1 glucosyl transferase [Thioclava dalianensis]SFN23151.1 Glycosyl transferase family 2 [Thioclava dalianensis]
MTVISVIIPVYNAAATLPATITALRAQSLREWEAILVEDGSSDESWQVAQALAARDPRITLLRNPGKGPSDARNFAALTIARAEILAFCDADDLWMPGKLASVMAAFADGRHACFGRIHFFNTDPRDSRTRSTVPSGPVSLPALIGENPVCTMSNLSIRREVFAALGGLRADMVHNEDLEFLVRLVGHGYRLQGIDADHVRYRMSPYGLSADLHRMRESRNEALRTAAMFGVPITPCAEAVHLRYLARRALRVGAPASVTLGFVLEGLGCDARAFLLPLHRGLATVCAAFINPVLPRALRRALFAN